MNPRTLYLAWQDNESRKWFPVGRLDADVGGPSFCFRYTGGAKRAEQEAGFPLLIEFPDLHRSYLSPKLFPVFQNRVMNRSRPEFADYVRRLDLPEGADPIEILSINGGSRVTDTYEVFPKLIKREDGTATCRFFLHGWRYVNPASQQRLNQLVSGEQLYMTVEPANPATGLAVQVQTTDYYMIGWTPRYLVQDLAASLIEAPSAYKAEVVGINPQPAPSKQRLLIEMTGNWGQHEPMTGEDFVPLVADPF